MWKPLDKELEVQLASEVAQIVKAVCPHAVVTYTTCQGYPRLTTQSLWKLQ